MEYNINFNEWGSMFSVPSSIVSKHLKLCSETQLKVILYILFNSNKKPTTEEISNELSINENEVENAISFWIDRKVLYTNEVPKEAEEKTSTKKTVKKIKTINKPDSHFVSRILKEDKNLAALMDEAQTVLKKTLSPSDMATLVFLYDSHGLPCEVLTLLLHYCSSIGKCNISQIEKIGLQWSEEEIYTLKQAEEKIKDMSRLDNAWHKVSKCFGIKNVGRPTKTQIKYASLWINDWNFSTSMISEAYDRCIDKKGSFDMAYINGILKRWYDKGVKTLDAAKKLDEEKKSKGNSKKSGKTSVFSSDSATYNLSDYEKKSIFDED